MKRQTTVSAILAPLLLFVGASVVEGQITNLNSLDSLSTGVQSITADSQTFDGFVDHDGTNGWLLIGRGREGWEFDTDGQGAPGDVGQNLGVAAGFAPSLYSDAIVNDLISNSGIDMTDVEVRLKRAANTGGTAYQEGRLRDFAITSWTGDLDQGANAGDISVTWEIINAEVNGPLAPLSTGTRDTFGESPGNNGTRFFTWAWSGHNNQQGFSYGQTVQGTDGNSPTTFLWESGTENHAMPYTEVYIRRISAVPEPSSIALAVIGAFGLAALGWRRLRSAS